MLGSKTDKKNFQLRGQLVRLRHHIDVDRIIGLNVDAITSSKLSNELFGHLQNSAVEALAIHLCKIYESSQRNDLSSIPGIIESLTPTPVSTESRPRFEAFGRRYGDGAPVGDSKSLLQGTFGFFAGLHSAPLSQLRVFRDKIGAHAEYNARPAGLPTHAELEELYSFAYDFYAIVSRDIVGVSPAQLPSNVGKGLIALLNEFGLDGVQFDFPAEE